MKTKEAIEKAMAKNSPLRKEILKFACDHTRKYFVKSVMENDKERKYQKELYQYLSGVAQFYIYEVSLDAIENCKGELDEAEFKIGIESMVAQPILNEVAETSNQAVQDLMREYEEDRKKRGATA